MLGLSHRYRGEIPKLAAIFSRHGEQFGGIRFYSESACVNCIFLRYERVFNRARKATTSVTHIKVSARVICIAHSPHLFSAKSRIPPNCSPCREKNYVGGIETLGSLSLYLWIIIIYVQTICLSEISISSSCIPSHCGPEDRRIRCATSLQQVEEKCQPYMAGLTLC